MLLPHNRLEDAVQKRAKRADGTRNMRVEMSTLGLILPAGRLKGRCQLRGQQQANLTGAHQKAH